MFRSILLPVFLILSLTVIIFISCGKPVEHTFYTSNFEGRVIDADTLSPIEGAEVLCRPLDNVGDTIAVTDTAGIYRFSKIPIHTTWGTVELTVTKSGYNEFKKQYKVSSLENYKLPDILLMPVSNK